MQAFIINTNSRYAYYNNIVYGDRSFYSPAEIICAISCHLQYIILEEEEEEEEEDEVDR